MYVVFKEIGNKIYEWEDYIDYSGIDILSKRNTIPSKAGG